MLINSEKEMINLGAKIATKHSKILLYGDLGAGKTKFAKGFAKGLGIDEDIVQSPTYTYINIYDDKLLHIDMYRLDNEKDFIEKGILDQIFDYDFITIERPKFENHYLDENFLKIEIIKIEENSRKIQIKTK